MSSFHLALLGSATSGTVAIGLVPIFAIAMIYYRYLMADPETRVREVNDILPEYDFIIVGGGSAGAVVANRLSENPDWTVLLLEAGGDETIISDVPALAGYLQLSDLDWKYKTHPPADRGYCQAMNGHRCNWPRGKVLGGSSVLNAMVYVRGNRFDYDYWEAQGNTGWSYKDVLPYFLKSEDNRNPYLVRTPYHKEGGYLTVQESPWRSPLSVAFIKAGKEMGYDNCDINGANQTGFMLTQGTVRRGSRCSTAKAFIRPIKHRKNLHVALKAHVTKVLLAESNDEITAHGVEVFRHNGRHLINARKEVILSAGAINSPQLLMLSGIGPRQHLEALNIPVFRDLKVGFNLQDHVGLGGLTFLVDAPVTFTKSRFQSPSVALEYILRERGPMTNLGVEAVAFVNTKYAPPEGNWPDIQFHFAPSSVNSDGGDHIRKAVGLKDSVYNTVYKPLVKSETWTILPLLLRPKSTGRVSLRSSNPFEPPIIEPNYFRYREDVEVLTEGIKIAMAISNTTAFQKYGSRPHTVPLPGCGKYPLFSDAYWECSMRHFTFTIYHPTSTCKMGPETDPDAVVDDRLRVHGVKNLRVIDASIMPTIISGNPNAPVIMIGERASDFIKNEYFYLDETKK